MKKLGFIAMVVLAGCLLAAPLASERGQKTAKAKAGSTEEQIGALQARFAEAGLNKGMTAVEQTAEGSHDPARFTYPRLYCTPDGNSHFQSVTVELSKINFSPPAAPIYIGGNVPASSAFFGGFEAGWGAHDLETRLYHPAPAAQFVVVLEGVFSITATDGETRRFQPGDVFRVEDTSPCKGHITVVGDKPGFLLFAQ